MHACRQELAAAVAAEGLRPILARDTPPQLARLLEAAWQLQPEQRPTAAQLEAELRGIAEQLFNSSPSHAPLHRNQAANGTTAGGSSWLPIDLESNDTISTVCCSDPQGKPYLGPKLWVQ